MNSLDVWDLIKFDIKHVHDESVDDGVVSMDKTFDLLPSNQRMLGDNADPDIVRMEKNFEKIILQGS